MKKSAVLLFICILLFNFTFTASSFPNEVWFETTAREVDVGDTFEISVYCKGPDEYDAWIIGTLYYEYEKVNLLNVTLGEHWRVPPAMYSENGEMGDIISQYRAYHNIQSFNTEPIDGKSLWVTIEFEVIVDGECNITMSDVEVSDGGGFGKDALAFDLDYDFIIINGDGENDGGGYDVDDNGTEPDNDTQPGENQPPQCNVSGCDTAGLVSEEVTFDASGSTDDSGIIAYSWDFGDGISMNSSDAVVTHTYDEAGEYTVTLTVIDENGLSSSNEFAVFITGKESHPTTDDDNINDWVVPLVIIIGIVAVIILVIISVVMLKRRG